MRHPLLHAILLSLAACATREDGEACMLVDPGTTTCPDPADVSLDEIASPWDCDNEVRKMLATDAPEPTPAAFQDGSTGCCYEVEMVDKSPGSECIVGRPYHHDGSPIVAPTADGSPWARIGAAEHASIAAFAKLQLQLMAHGAPMALLARVAAAMADEVRHAELAFAEAAVEPGPFPFPGPTDPRVSLAALAADAVREGCVGETLSALATRRAAEVEPDPRLRAVLAGIADDEDRHAVLSWAIVAWALRVGGPEVREAVVAALAAPHAVAPLDLLSRDEMSRVAAVGLRDVVAPAATALLA